MIVFVAGPPIAEAAPLVGRGDSAGILSSSGGGTNLVWYVVVALAGVVAVGAVTYLASRAERSAMSVGGTGQLRAVALEPQEGTRENLDKAA